MSTDDGFFGSLGLSRDELIPAPTQEVWDSAVRAAVDPMAIADDALVPSIDDSIVEYGEDAADQLIDDIDVDPVLSDESHEVDLQEWDDPDDALNGDVDVEVASDFGTDDIL